MNSNRLLEERFEEALKGIVKQWLDEPEEQETILGKISSVGGVQAVKAALHRRNSADEFLSPWADDRPDLTFEAIALCPAWDDLFTADERAIARARLSETHAKYETRPERRTKTWRDTWVFWIDGRPVGADRHGREDSESPAPTCEMFARAARTLAEIGQFGASFYQRRHFHSCSGCLALPSLNEIITLLDQEEFRRLRVLLRALSGSLDRGWIAIVLCTFIDSICEIEPEHWVEARQGMADRTFSEFVKGLDPFEYFAYPLAKRVGIVFDPPELACADELALPSDGVLTPEPGVLNTAISSDEWYRLLDPRVDMGGDDRLDEVNFVHLAIEATSFQMMHWWKDGVPEYVRPDSLPLLSAFESPTKPAEASLRATLGHAICNELGIAFVYLVQAEQIYLDLETPTGDMIILSLALGFQRRLEDAIIAPFKKALDKAGLRDYPWPMKAGRLTLGDIKSLLTYPPPQLADILRARNLDLTAVVSAVRDVKQARDHIAHLDRHYTTEDARLIRHRWFGADRGDGGIFGLLRPTPKI
jgi:hypothetical protein